MSKYILGFLLLFITGAAIAQKPGRSRIELISSKVSSRAKLPSGKVVYKFKEGVFKQDFSTLTADSSLAYFDDNLVDAFGHVIINQGDTLHIYSDKLHYDGNTKIATLTGNVKMVDKDATLLTDYFTYNTATKYGTYTGGGKLFNKENTLVSQNGYYFAGSRDAYFRYNVVLTTPDAIIKTDTLRYNSGTRISWFYGPTTITGTKDKDVLYTEDGRYETIPEQAFFGKKNLYTQGTKSLKGDSLFYDRLKGYGRAVKNVVFDDKEQHIVVKGHLGEYYKAAERAIITQNPYVIFVTQDSSKNNSSAKKDSVIKKDSTALILAKNAPAINKATNAAAVIRQSLPANALPAQTALPAQATLKAVTDSVMKAAQKAIKSPVTTPQQVQNQSARINTAINNQITEARKQAIEKVIAAPKRDSIKTLSKDSIAKRTAGVDSMYMGADTIDTRVITFKELKAMKLARYLLEHPDTAAKKVPSIVYTKANLPKVLTVKVPSVSIDTSFIKRDFFSPKPKPAPKVVAKPAPPKGDSTAKVVAKKSVPAKDTLALNPNKLTDTSRIRIIVGYHAAKIFKSDLQAKADSLFYSSSDSTIRMYVNPIIWTQGSQLTGDTIALQMKNRKLDNVDMFPNGFIVNIEKNDSLHFNQAAGRKIHGTFKDNRLNTLTIDGNAETIYYNRDTVKNRVTEMVHTIGNLVKANFKNGKLSRGNTYGNTENKVNPPVKLKDDDKILKGFIWKPKERPASKEAITGVANKPSKAATSVKPPAGKKPGTTGATGGKKDDGKKVTGTSPQTAAADSATKKAVPPKPVTYEVIISN
ncbi:OstA-like protein [Mucilaginibacter auburnensis]|uniref:OstA-like protein n=1 Tax=Mucilaginibacter auburnensis TaxID=1457233 RepID=A0A2H9VPJ8_9SPHI|nr:OstA-like protein [Mucilaginibacter auburnensis]PJJ80246.1 OstA-like protein [Mucilaginibacter auburnensis]